MNINNFSIVEEMGKKILTYVIDETIFDDISTNVVTNNSPYFLPKFSLTQKNGDMIISYDVTNYMSASFFSATLSVENFIKLMTNIMNPFDEISDWFIYPSQLCLNLEYIFIKKDNFDVKYTFVPEYSNNDFLSEFKELILTVLGNCNITGDSNFQAEIYKYLAINKFNIDEFKEILENYESKNDKNVTNVKIQHNDIPKAKPKNKAVFMTNSEGKISVATENKNTPQINNNVQKNKNPKVNKDSSLKYDIESLQFGNNSNNSDIDDLINSSLKGSNKKGFGLFSSKKNQEQLDTSEKETNKATNNQVIGGAVEKRFDIPASIPISNVKVKPKFLNDNITEIVDENEDSGAYSLSLIANVDAPKTINLSFNGNKFVIGRKDKNGMYNSDFHFSDNIRSISRQQACFSIEGDSLLLMDLGSANGTYVNNQKLQPNSKIQVYLGDTISFSDKGYDYQLV